MENIPFFARVVVKKKIQETQENEFLKEKNQDNTFILVSAGSKCEDEVREHIGKSVLISNTNSMSLKIEDGWEYFVISQESLLAY